MPRLPRIYIEDSLYYITSRGSQAEGIFRDKEDYMIYLELLKKYKEQHGFKLFSFALMPQQLNMLLEVKEGMPQGGTISDIMHDITSSYTKYYNNRYQRQGHLFQARFKSAIVEKGPYLLSTISCLHLLPVQLGLSNDPSSYPYSSYSLYLDNPSLPAQTVASLKNIINLKEEINEVNALVNRIAKQNSAAEFFNSLPKQETDELSRRLQRARIVGSQRFLDKVEEILDNRSASQEQEVEAGEGERKFRFKPLVSVVSIALLFGATAAVVYIQKNTLVKKEKAVTKSAQQQVTSTPLSAAVTTRPLITELDGSEWSIQVKSASENAQPETFYDKLQFRDGQVTSKVMSEKGFGSSNYTLKTREDGTFSWETMQRDASGEISFWQGETDLQGRMSGTFSRKSKEGQEQVFSFASVEYIYRR